MNKKPIITAIESDNDGYLTITVKGRNAKRVARVVEYADEMLEALEYVRRFVKKENVDTDYIDAIIAKAKGETE